jgi:hypothetical protein
MDKYSEMNPSSHIEHAICCQLLALKYGKLPSPLSIMSEVDQKVKK